MQLIIKNKQNKKKTLIMNGQKPFRQNRYYKAYHVKHKSSSKASYQVIKLIALAKPNLSPYDIYALITIPTIHITKEFTSYMDRFYQHSIGINKSSSFTELFLGNKHKETLIRNQNREISLWNFVQQWSKCRTDIVKLKSTTIEVKQMTYTSVHQQLVKVIDNEYFLSLKKYMKKSIKNIKIKFSSQKIERVQQICQQLQSQTTKKFEYYIEQTSTNTTSTYLLTDPIELLQNNKSIKEFTVGELINNKNKFQFSITEEQLQIIAIELFKQIYNFKEQSHNKIAKFNVEQGFMTYYFVNPQNVFIRLSLEQESNRYSLSQENPCDIDLVYPFLCQLGLSQNLFTVQQKIMLCSSQHPIIKAIDLQKAIKKQLRDNDVQDWQLMQCCAIVHWICLIDYISAKLMNFKENQFRKSVLEMVKGQDIVKMINNHTQDLTNLPSFLLTAYRLEYCQENFPLVRQLRYESFDSFFQSLKQSEQTPPKTNYYKVQLFLKFKQLIFLQKQGLKFFFQKSRPLATVQIEQKFTIIYLICKWGQFSSYKEMLEYKGVSIDQLSKNVKENKNLPHVIIQALSTFDNIQKRIEKKFEQKKGSKSMPNKPLDEKEISISKLCSLQIPQGKILKTLQQHLKSFKYQIRKRFQNIIHKIKQQKNIKENVESFKICRKNLCFMVLFFQVKNTNYAEFCSIYEAIINQNDRTLEKGLQPMQLESFYEQSEQRIKSCLSQQQNLFWANLFQK